MKKYLVLSTLIASGSLMASASYGESLSEIYQQAIKNDPTYQQNEADWASAKQTLPQARSYALPNVELEATSGYTWASGSTTLQNKSHDTTYTLTAIQPIFNFAVWKGLTYAKATVKSATALFLSQKQDLIQRTTAAYFQVLQDIATLNNTRSTKEQYYRQMITNQQKFKVGLIAVVEVYNAQAQYDAQVAQEIADTNTLRSDLEALSAITGHNYTQLNGVSSSMPLVIPKPNNMDTWVSTASDQNYTLQSAKYATLAAKENIGLQASQAYPSLGAEGIAGYDEASTTARHAYTGILALTFYPFQGGLTLSQTKQARSDYASYSAQEEYALRSVVQGTRTAFLNINSSIQAIKADQKAIDSSEQSYQATNAGYAVGTKTLEDVLTSIATLASAKQAYLQAEYTYLNAIVSLKESAGTLSTEDVNEISQWLNDQIDITNLLKTTSQEQTTKNPPSSSKKKPAPVKKITASHAPAEYTVQLFASHTQKEAKQFIKSQKINSKTVQIVKIGPWYKVISQHFSRYPDAQQALKSIQAQTPQAWIYKLPNSYQTLS